MGRGMGSEVLMALSDGKDFLYGNGSSPALLAM